VTATSAQHRRRRARGVRAKDRSRLLRRECQMASDHFSGDRVPAHPSLATIAERVFDRPAEAREEPLFCLAAFTRRSAVSTALNRHYGWRGEGAMTGMSCRTVPGMSIQLLGVGSARSRSLHHARNTAVGPGTCGGLLDGVGGLLSHRHLRGGRVQQRRWHRTGVRTSLLLTGPARGSRLAETAEQTPAWPAAPHLTPSRSPA
jgi:hypothetical protein